MTRGGHHAQCRDVCTSFDHRRHLVDVLRHRGAWSCFVQFLQPQLQPRQRRTQVVPTAASVSVRSAIKRWIRSCTDLLSPLSQPGKTLWILPEQIGADTIARIGFQPDEQRP